MPPKLSIEQMAEIYELRNKGVAWWNISQIYNVSDKTLKKYYRQSEMYGFDLWTEWRD